MLGVASGIFVRGERPSTFGCAVTLLDGPLTGSVSGPILVFEAGCSALFALLGFFASAIFAIAFFGFPSMTGGGGFAGGGPVARRTVVGGFRIKCGGAFRTGGTGSSYGK